MEEQFEHYPQIFCPCVGSDENDNLYVPQKELLLCHLNLGTSMYTFYLVW